MPPKNLPSLLFELWCSLKPRRRSQFKLMLVLMAISAFAEVVSLGAVLPFLGLLAVPEEVFHYPWIRSLAEELAINRPAELMLPATLFFALAALTAGGVRLLLLWASTRLAYAAGADLSIEVYRRTLYQPYRVHLQRNSSEVISGITSKVWGATNALYQVLGLATSVIMLVSIMAALLAINAAIASMAAATFGLAYGFITWISRSRLRQNGIRSAQESTQAVKALQEGLGGIRDVLLDGTQLAYCDIYRQSQDRLYRALGNNAFIVGSPRFVMEAFGMVVISVLAYWLGGKEGGVGASLPLLGALALGAQRLLPALQQGYTAWASIAGSQASIADSLELLNQPLPDDAFRIAPPPLVFRDSIRFELVSFRYGEESPMVLADVDTTINKGARVGLVGSTGSGKSTALDLLMGLLEASSGRVLVDGEPILGLRRRAWQRTIAHVPQNIFLSDASLAENIAFGIPVDAIDMQQVRHAARKAQMADFIESMPEGYALRVGERGIRLSGGQRQRIGIARALYKQASVLVFDEATSALDSGTEREVMTAIEGLDRDLTIILVAHRLSTVKRCDKIIELVGGKVVAEGPFDYLLEHSATFRRMAVLSPPEGIQGDRRL